MKAARLISLLLALCPAIFGCIFGLGGAGCGGPPLGCGAAPAAGCGPAPIGCAASYPSPLLLPPPPPSPLPPVSGGCGAPPFSLPPPPPPPPPPAYQPPMQSYAQPSFQSYAPPVQQPVQQYVPQFQQPTYSAPSLPVGNYQAPAALNLGTIVGGQPLPSAQLLPPSPEPAAPVVVQAQSASIADSIEASAAASPSAADSSQQVSAAQMTTASENEVKLSDDADDATDLIMDDDLIDVKKVKKIKKRRAFGRHV